jgi:hypothetical protein
MPHQFKTCERLAVAGACFPFTASVRGRATYNDAAVNNDAAADAWPDIRCQLNQGIAKTN